MNGYTGVVRFAFEGDRAGEGDGVVVGWGRTGGIQKKKEKRKKKKACPEHSEGTVIYRVFI